MTDPTPNIRAGSQDGDSAAQGGAASPHAGTGAQQFGPGEQQPWGGQGSGGPTWGGQSYGGSQYQDPGQAQSEYSHQGNFGDTQNIGDTQNYAGQQYRAPGAPAPRLSAYPPAGPGYPACPSPNVGWAVASILFFPLAFVAFIRAFEVYPLWMQGRFAEAEAASRTAALLGKIALGVWAVLVLLYVLSLFIAVVTSI